MLKRWAALPPGIRWLAGAVALVLAAAIVWALFVPLADLLAHHDVGSAAGALHETALDNARGRLLTLGAGLVAGGALVFTALNFNLLRRNSEQTDQWQRRTHELTEQGQITDRYTKAVEQLGSDKLDVRIGGIYALERIARDSGKDHPTVMEVLTAFIREHSREQRPSSDAGQPAQDRSTRPDVQAAVTVVGRRDTTRDILTVDLGGADLTRARLGGADLGGAHLRGAQLTKAVLTGARLDSADLVDADLTEADLIGANLRHAHLDGAKLAYASLLAVHLDGAGLMRADLTGANLRSVHLGGADLRGADLDFVHLDGADLTGANLRSARGDGVHLTGAILPRADLTAANLDSADLTAANLDSADLAGARLTGADLAGADLTRATLNAADLTGAHLDSARLDGADLTLARWPEGVQVPDGWMVDSSSGLLKRAGRLSEVMTHYL